MLNNGHLAHPDIWMLWFSFFVAVGVFLYVTGWAAIEIYSLIDWFSSQSSKDKKCVCAICSPEYAKPEYFMKPSDFREQSFYRPSRRPMRMIDGHPDGDPMNDPPGLR